MADTREVTVPDLGDVEAAEVIDVLVAPGDSVEPETPLVTIESEKSAMDLPSPAAGVVDEIKVKVGDQIGAGDLVLTLRTEGGTSQAPADDAGDADKAADGADADAGDTEADAETDADADAAEESSAAEDNDAAEAAAPADADTGGTTHEVTVPDLGDVEAAEVIDVLVAPGDSVEPETPLVTIESEKSAMDLPSPAAGVVDEIKVKVGDQIGAGDLVLTLRTEGGASQAPADDAGDADAAAGRAENDTGDADESAAADTEADADASDVPPPARGDAQDGKRERDTASRRPPPAAGKVASGERQPTHHGSQVPDPRAPTHYREPEPGEAGPPRVIDEEGFRRAHASPSVRRFARELGVDLTEIDGRGPKGRILKQDVQDYVKGRLKARPSVEPAAAGTGIPPIPSVDFSRFGDTTAEPLHKIRRLTARNTQRAWLNIPHVTQFEDADVTELEAFRQQEKERAAREDVRLTPVAFLLKACAHALRAMPRFNSSLAPDGQSLILKHYVNIGVAVETDNGLLVPVLRDVDRKGIFELARELVTLSGQARDGKLSADAMRGGCFTITSLGGIGGTAFTPIINAPEVAILGASRNVVRPVWQAEAFVPRTILPLSLSYDHRVIDGAEAARFTSYLAELLGDIRRLLL